MALHRVPAFSRFVLGLKGATLVEQWGSHVAKVGGKVFALLAADGSQIVFKVSELSFEVLTELDGIGQAAYFAKRQWVGVGPGALTDAELRSYIRASYETIAARLTRRARLELGLG